MPKAIHPHPATKGKIPDVEALPECDRYGIITLATNDAVWDLDVESHRIEWNDNFYHLFGYSHEDDISGLDFWVDKLHPDDLERVSRSLDAAMNGNSDNWQEEYRFRKADGTYTYVLDRGFLIRDRNKRPVRMLGAMQDITSRKHAEEQLRRSEQRFRALIEHSSDITALFDAEGRVTYTTPSRHRILGFTAAEVLGRSLSEFIHPLDRSLIEKRFAECLKHPGKVIHLEGRATHHDGSVHWLEGTFKNLLHDPSIQAIVCNYRDISKRKESEEERSRLAAIIETTSDIVGIANAELTTFYLNKAGKDAMGFRATDDICHMSIKDYHPEWAREIVLREAIPIATKQGNWSGETAILKRNGEEIPVSQIILCHKSDSGAVQYYSTVIRDISDRKRAETAVRRANQELEERVRERTKQLETVNKELEAFSYTVSHDLRAPVRAIQGLSEAIQEDCGSSMTPDCREYFDRLSGATKKMQDLINDLLELAQVNRAKMHLEWIDPSELVLEAVAELKRDNPRDLRISPTPQAKADRRLLSIALENLLNNAWKFTSHKENAKIEFGASLQNGETIYFLRDNGAGFDMNMASRLFIPFERLHPASEFEGTGVGLATVSRIITRHGGRIWAEGAIGEGATFFFTLPS